MGHIEWRKSTYSGASKDCVEVAGLNDGDRAVRDSKDPAGPMLKFTSTEWSTFIAGVRASESV
jgi:uncharacterized protein DUF397